MYAPRKKRRYAKASSNALENFLQHNLVSLKRELVKEIAYKYDGKINWMPNKQPTGPMPKPKGLGTNNTHYVVPKINALFGGRTVVDGNPDWKKVEQYACEAFDLYQDDPEATRNIDFWRKFTWEGEEYEQACEIKKTTGCFDKQPVFIRSSKQQIEVLGGRAIKPNQISPSLYIVGSCDYDSENKWVITWWFVPIKDAYDFICFNTSDYYHDRYETYTNDGWVKPV